VWTVVAKQCHGSFSFSHASVRTFFVDGLEESVGERGGRAVVVVALYVKVCMTLVLTCSKDWNFCQYYPTCIQHF